MNRDELKELLQELAETDLSDGADINDHPCSVAVRAIDQCFDDIATMQKISHRFISMSNASKKVNHLCHLTYDPQW